MATGAMIGHGSQFMIGDGGSPEVYTAVAEVKTITGPALARDTVDATHMSSPEKWREYIAGLRDAGEVSMTVNCIPGSAGETAILTAFQNDELQNFKIVWPNAAEWILPGFLTGYDVDDPLDDIITATTTVKLSGKPTFIPAV